MGTFADVLVSALRREESRARAVATPSIDLDSAAAASVAATVDVRPAWARTLGLDDDACTAEDVRRAFRRRAFETHPDRGGAVEAFVAVKRAHDEAMNALRGGSVSSSVIGATATRARRRANAYEART